MHRAPVQFLQNWPIPSTQKTKPNKKKKAAASIRWVHEWGFIKISELAVIHFFLVSCFTQSLKCILCSTFSVPWIWKAGKQHRSLLVDDGRCDAQPPKLGTMVIQTHVLPIRAESILVPVLVWSIWKAGREMAGGDSKTSTFTPKLPRVPLHAEGIPAGSQQGAAGCAATSC